MKGNKRFLSPYSTGISCLESRWSSCINLATFEVVLMIQSNLAIVNSAKDSGRRDAGFLKPPIFCVCGMGFLHIFLLQGAKDLGEATRIFLPNFALLSAKDGDMDWQVILLVGLETCKEFLDTDRNSGRGFARSWVVRGWDGCVFLCTKNWFVIGVVIKTVKQFGDELLPSYMGIIIIKPL